MMCLTIDPQQAGLHLRGSGRAERQKYRVAGAVYALRSEVVANLPASSVPPGAPISQLAVVPHLPIALLRFSSKAKLTARAAFNATTATSNSRSRSGTIFEDSHIPTRKWLMAFALLCSAKKGISALQLQRELEFGSYR